MSIFSIALTFFLVANPVGNVPAIASLVKDFDFERQKKIVFREAMIALLIALFFQFFGEFFLGMLQVKDYAVTLTGGVVLLIVGLNMIFNVNESAGTLKEKVEPFIVPIATPIISGAGLMSVIMLYSKQEDNNWIITGAILIAWVGVTVILVSAPYLQKILGRRMLVALEQLMGMLLAMLSMQMVVNGANLFIKSL